MSPRPGFSASKLSRIDLLSILLAARADVQVLAQIIDVQTPEEAATPQMTFDPVWLAISRAFHPQLSLKVQQAPLPSEQTICKALIEKELHWLQQNVKEGGKVPIAEVQQFQQTAPFPGQPGGDDTSPGKSDVVLAIMLVHA